MSSQPSLFTRLTVVEAELLAMKDMLAELKVNQDELRRDRDEWRWPRSVCSWIFQRGAWWRWHRRADEVLDAATSWFRGVLADGQNTLSEIRANGDELREDRDQWRSGAKRILMDQRESGGGTAS